MAPADRRVAVTGVGGYLGGRVLVALADAVGLSRSPVPWLPAERQVRADLLGPVGDLEPLLAGADAVVHLAGHNEVVTAGDPARAVAETVAMAEHVGAAAAAAGVRRVVYVSTVHVYGSSLEPGATIDEATPTAPTSDYARARLAAEEALLGDDRLDVVVLRLTNAVGAAVDPSVDRWTLVANDLCRQAVLDGELVLHSAGLQWRDFVVLADACRAIAGAADPGAVTAGTYNLGSGAPTRVRTLAELVQDRVAARCGERPRLVAPPATEPGSDAYVVVVERLAAAGLRATSALVDGVDEIVAQCVAHRGAIAEAVRAAR